MSPTPVTTAVPPLPTTPSPFCSEGELREISSNYSSVRSIYGTFQNTVDYRFEVCIGYKFTSICDIGWDNKDATVACKDIEGFFDGGMSQYRLYIMLSTSITVSAYYKYKLTAKQAAGYQSLPACIY